MKRKLLTFVLAVLTVGLLGSCSKLNERIDNLEKRFDGIENNQIASVGQQITAINASINDLKAADATINGKITELKATAEAQQTLINALKEADQALGQKDAALEARIATLEGQVVTINSQIKTLEDADKAINVRIDELKSYIDTELGKAKDWATATFATLAQYQQTADDLAALSVTISGISSTLAGVQTSIAALDTKIDGIDAALQEKITIAKTELEDKISDLKTELEGKIAEAISTSETGLQSWVNEQLSAYYTAAQIDAKIADLKSAIDALESDNDETNKTKIAELETKLTQLTQALEDAKTTIKTEYEAAIATAINDYNGTITQTIQTKINEVNATIADLTGRVETLETTVGILSGRIDALEGMIQSVVFAPTYEDGAATYSYLDGSYMYIDFMVNPVSVAKTLAPEDATLLLKVAQTRASFFDYSFVSEQIVAKDADNGVYSFVVKLSPDAVSDIATGLVSASLKLTKGKTEISSDFVKVKAEVPTIYNLLDWMDTQYFDSQGWNGEGTIRLYYGCYPGMNSSKYMTGWTNTMCGAYRIQPGSTYSSHPWIYYYNIVREANLILNYFDNASLADTEEKMFLKAQTLTLRAYCFFQLSQLYCFRWQDSNNGASRGIILRTEDLGVKRNYSAYHLKDQFDGMFGENTNRAASTLKETYDQIFKDLDDALNIFSELSISRDNMNMNYLPNADVAHAIYAHAAISKEDWALAAEHAEKARENYSIMTNDEYKAGFSTVNREWIWSTPDYNNLYYYSYLAYVASNAIASQVRNYPLMISKQLIDQIPETDIRRSLYLIPKSGETFNKNSGKANTALENRAKTEFAQYFPENSSNFSIYTYMQFKIRLADPVADQPGIGPICLFRAADMYYLEAEAKYHMGLEADAQSILVQLVQPRDPSYTSCTKTGEDLLNEIKLYRNFDGLGEGFDWFDHKRWGEDYKRLSYSNGGNFFSQIAIDLPSDLFNRWTWVYPDVETSQNSLVTTTDSSDPGSGTQKYNNNNNPNWF